MVIIIKNIYKAFLNSSSGFILDIPHIEFKRGILSFVMGKNGSGKSLLLKTLFGELASDKQVSLQLSTSHYEMLSNLENAHLAEMVECKLLRQNARENLALELTVKENFILHFTYSNLREKFFPKKFFVNQLEKKLALNPHFLKKQNQCVSELSGGQQQALAFFLTTLYPSKLLLLDEFFSATDYSTTECLLAKAEIYAQENEAAVIIVSHDIETALRHGREIFILSNGKYIETIQRDSLNWNREYIKNKIIR